MKKALIISIIFIILLIGSNIFLFSKIQILETKISNFSLINDSIKKTEDNIEKNSKEMKSLLENNNKEQEIKINENKENINKLLKDFENFKKSVIYLN